MSRTTSLALLAWGITLSAPLLAASEPTPGVWDQLGGGELARGAQASAFLVPTELPASFVYGGRPSSQLLANWPKTETPAVESDGRRMVEWVWREPGGGLVATWHVELFQDRPAVEFRWIFAHSGERPSRALSDVYALDLQALKMTRARLVHSSGGLMGPFVPEATAFLVSESTLKQPLSLAGAGGRSSNKDLPFFVLHDDASQGGIYVGIGWSGQWQADFRPTQAPSDALQVTAGMPGMNLVLSGGKQIRSPSILLGTYQGDAQAGSNALRRTLYDHYVARLGSEKPLPPVSWNHWFTFTNNVSEALLRQQADAAADVGLEYFCIDSGWFEGGFPAGVGNWTIDRAKFPNGLAPIGEYVAARGMKLGLWFEIGRADPGTRLAQEHPEWMSGNQVRLELPEARQWLFAMMCRYIDEGQVRWIRYDYNFDPLTEWNRRDRPETQGLSQIDYITGEYELFDRLRAKYPELLIESCASGGRRIDLETIRRAHTFWKSDETSNLIAARGQQTGGNRLLPGVLLNTNLPASSTATMFDLHSLFGGPLGFASDWTRLDATAKGRVRQAIAEYKSVRHLLDKDYYALLPQSYEVVHWVAWEFVDPERGEALLVALRPVESPYGEVQLPLRGLGPSQTYRVCRLDGSQPRTLSGQELQAGLAMRLGPGESEVLHLTRP